MGLARVAQRAWLVAVSALAAAFGTLALSSLVPSAALAAAEAPVIESETSSGVTSTDATLNATIDTKGFYTSYEFEVATSSSYDNTRSACPLPLPGFANCAAIIGGPSAPEIEPAPEHIAAGLGVRSVSIDLASIGATLQPGTIYHYRAIGANTSNGQTVYGSDQTFTTSAAPGTEPPTIESKSATITTPTELTPHKSRVGNVKRLGRRSEKHKKTRKHKSRTNTTRKPNGTKPDPSAFEGFKQCRKRSGFSGRQDSLGDPRAIPTRMDWTYSIRFPDGRHLSGKIRVCFLGATYEHGNGSEAGF